VKTLSTGTFKRFTIAVLKLACGIALAALILGLAAWGIVSFRERSEEAANAPLATLRTWPEVTVSALANIKVRLQTVWRSGNIYYQFDVQGYPSELRQAMERESQAAFTINFLDSDGFRLFEHRLPIAEMSRAVGADGQPTGASWKGDESIVADLYRRAARWELGWFGFAPAPAQGPAAPSAPSVPLRKPVSLPLPKPVSPARPRWKDVSVWRGLSHGMSQDDVKRILGEPEKVSDLGFQVTWYYGYPFGGEVTFSQDGRVSSWSEP
jgi:hypothetical protein